MADGRSELTTKSHDAGEAKATNFITKGEEEIKAKIQSENSPSHDKETHGTSNDIDEDTPIEKVKGPGVLERAKEEVEALVEAVYPDKSTRNRTMSSRLTGYVIEDGVKISNQEELLLATEDEPRNYNEAKGNPKWEEAMETELKSIVKNKTWELTELPKDHKLLITGSSLGQIERFKKLMMEQFEMTDLGRLTYDLGTEVAQGRDGIKITQSNYAKKILKQSGMQDSNPSKVPMEPGTVVSKDERGDPVDPKEYRKIIGCLRYLLHTRPDLSFLVSMASRYMQEPKSSHMQLIKQILRYLKGSIDVGIHYKKGGDRVLVGYNDSSHSPDKDDGKSTSGVIFYFNGAPVTWVTQKQATVALSSFEAEFMAVTEGAKQAVWLRGLLNKITGWKEQTVPLRVDNMPAIALMKNPVFHGKSKHIHTRFHYIRECVDNEQVRVKHVSGEVQKTDILTKPLARVKFHEMRKLMGVEDPPNPMLKLGGGGG
ncbi:hypothetical protein SSX86_010107 [Deinandra increscens subsp. villosa]|uniref:Reverse transcriptase Ty1/copia-type domain-containing protein n=1 Tax=Deinandra increscens subsp. villosa TaxID=3103831 RepID=A0AAP0DEN1_9ASTR